MNKKENIKEIVNHAESIKDEMEFLYERLYELENTEERKDPLKFLVGNENLRMYLYKLLGRRSFNALKKAIRDNRPIVISGANYITGKTTLKNVLKHMGVNVMESTDVHEIKLNNFIAAPIQNLEKMLFDESTLKPSKEHWFDFYEKNKEFIIAGNELSAVYSLYLKFCNDNKIEPLNDLSFYKKMHRYFSMRIVLKNVGDRTIHMLVKEGEADGTGKEL